MFDLCRVQALCELHREDIRPPVYGDKEETVQDFYAALLIGFHECWGQAVGLDPHGIKCLPPQCWLPTDLAGLERLRAHMEAERAALDRGRLAIRLARGELVGLLETASGRDRGHFDVEAVPYSMTEALDNPGTLSLIRLVACVIASLAYRTRPSCAVPLARGGLHPARDSGVSRCSHRTWRR